MRVIQRQQLVIDDAILKQERLEWFVRAAVGSTSITLVDAECESRIPAQQHFAPSATTPSYCPHQIHRTLECVGASRGFGSSELLSVAFFEVSYPTGAGAELRNITQLHMALLKLHTRLNASDPLQPLRTVPPLTDLPASSWLRQLRFPGVQPHTRNSTTADGELAVPFLAVQACTAPFPLLLEASTMTRRRNLSSEFAAFKLLSHPLLPGPRAAGVAPGGGFIYLPGFAISGSHIGLVSGVATAAPGVFAFLRGLEVLLPKVGSAHEEVLVNMAGFVPIEGCVWPSLDMMEFVLDINDAVEFCDEHALHKSSDRSLLHVDGVMTPPRRAMLYQPAHLIFREDSEREIVLTILLSSIQLSMQPAAPVVANGPDCCRHYVEAAADLQSYQTWSIAGTVFLGHWHEPLSLRWLDLANVTITLDFQVLLGCPRLHVAGARVSAHGEMTVTYDVLTPRPFPTAALNVSVPVDVLGTSSFEFPEVMLLVSSELPPLAGPASLVRTLSQDPTHLSVRHISCGTSAVRDLSSPGDIASPDSSARPFSVTISTWDAGEFEALQYDPRNYSCVVARRGGGAAQGGGSSGEHGGGASASVSSGGSAESGTECVFPFRYKGRIFRSCSTNVWSLALFLFLSLTLSLTLSLSHSLSRALSQVVHDV